MDSKDCQERLRNYCSALNGASVAAENSCREASEFTQRAREMSESRYKEAASKTTVPTRGGARTMTPKEEEMHHTICYCQIGFDTSQRSCVVRFGN